MQYAVYVMTLKPTSRCKRTEPYQYYVGSTYVDESHGVKDRIQDHRNGHNSNVIKRGYKITSGKQVSLHPSRLEAEEAEKEHAIQMRDKGFKVWQA